MKISNLFMYAWLFLIAACVGHPSKATERPVAVTKGSIAPIEIRNAKVPFDDVVTGGTPTFDQLAKAKAIGFTTVIDLRSKEEQGEGEKESSWADKLGLRYFSIPVKGKEDVSVQNAELLKKRLEDLSNYPLIVHCASGNRVGALFALKAFFLDKEDSKTALQIGREAGLTTLEPTVLERIETGKSTK